MTIADAIARADAVKPNGVPEAEKIRWLTGLECIIKNEIVDTHSGWEEEPAAALPSALGDALFAPPPFDETYVMWLLARIDFINGEYDAYANSSAVFNSAFSAFADHVNRTKTPKSAALRYE